MIMQHVQNPQVLDPCSVSRVANGKRTPAAYSWIHAATHEAPLRVSPSLFTPASVCACKCRVLGNSPSWMVSRATIFISFGGELHFVAQRAARGKCFYVEQEILHAMIECRSRHPVYVGCHDNVFQHRKRKARCGADVGSGKEVEDLRFILLTAVENPVISSQTIRHHGFVLTKDPKGIENLDLFRVCATEIDRPRGEFYPAMYYIRPTDQRLLSISAGPISLCPRSGSRNE